MCEAVSSKGLENGLFFLARSRPSLRTHPLSDNIHNGNAPVEEDDDDDGDDKNDDGDDDDNGDDNDGDVDQPT